MQSVKERVEVGQMKEEKLRAGVRSPRARSLLLWTIFWSLQEIEKWTKSVKPTLCWLLREKKASLISLVPLFL